MYKSLFCFLWFLLHFFSPLLWRGAGGEVFAQHPEANRANIWCFDNGAGLDFSSGSPVAITNGALHTHEGCASMCDLNGNLLMYTDGDQSVVNQWQLFTGTTATAQTERFKLFVPANDSCVIIKSTTSGLILADNKTQISVEELKKMQEQIASLQQQLAILQKQLAELKK